MSVCSECHNESGVALITVMLIVSLATITAVAMTTRQQLDIHRTANLINGEQAYLYALGGENWIKRILLRDNKKVDSLQDIWATSIPALPIPGGYITGQAIDLQGRFNLNNLLQEDGQISSSDVIVLERLLSVLELPISLAQMIVDWIDTNEERLVNGAEDNVYLMKNPAYRTANRLLIDPSEIRLLVGVEEYYKLLPYISTLPTRTSINVNTTSDKILMALVEGLTENDVAMLLAEREQQPFSKLQDFINHEILAGLKIYDKHLSIFSSYFLFTSEVKIARGRVKLNSVLHRANNEIKIIMRSN
ncbi:type II secretion system minor pseudopilin GspK [Candidatus Halobeggiatoa sp. HSG11]|nr:type II secretion system minor pseudopilin GspK [Candidatus Halobeggiatoa sp. HSG11]